MRRPLDKEILTAEDQFQILRAGLPVVIKHLSSGILGIWWMIKGEIYYNWGDRDRFRLKPTDAELLEVFNARIRIVDYFPEAREILKLPEQEEVASLVLEAEEVLSRRCKD